MTEEKTPLKWKFKAGGKISSSPFIEDGLVYVGSEDNYLYALDIDTGKEKWKAKTYGTIWSLVSSNGVVYFGSLHYLYALDGKTGKEKWKFETGGYVSSPILSEGILYFGSDDSHLYALDSKTGKEKWKFEVEDYITSSPAVSEGIVFFVSQDNNLYAVDIENGKVKWQYNTNEFNVVSYSTPAVSDGVVFFGGFNATLNSNPVLDHTSFHAVDIKTGMRIWEKSAGGVAYPFPAASKGIRYGTF